MVRLRPAVRALSLLLCLPAAALAAAPPPGLRLDAAPQGRLLDTPGAQIQSEIVTFSESLAPALLQVPLESEVQIDEWPVAPGERAAVVLTRFDVYAPDAKIWKVGRGGMTEVPRSRLAFFRGRAENDPDLRVFLAVDPASSTFSGFTASADQFQEIHSLRETQPKALASEHLIAAADPLADPDPDKVWSCDQTGAPMEFLEHKAEASTTVPIFAEAITSLHTATIAIDTDNEFVNNKFGGNTTTATNYIASLFAGMTVIYERDLLIRLLQGTTFLRTAADPYTSTGSTYDKMTEFQNYWNANQTGVTRAAAAMLSARGSSGAAGIAWIDVLCNNSYAYSYTQVFLSGTTVSSSEIMVVAHEIGHNFGSPHTHCYTPPLDNCYNSESGCYTGTKSCPSPITINGVPNVTGTLMSYCHLGGIGCTTANVFHPGTVALLQPKIQSKVNVCVFPAVTAPAPTVSTVTPVSGPTTGGTAVTITGTNFQSGATVSFGGTAASSVTFNSSTQLTATTPARAAGTVGVTVTNPGGQSATKASAFTFMATVTPAISSVGPASGTTAGGAVVTITGSNFQSGATVTFGGTAAASVTFNSSTKLTATAPAHAGGTVNVVVTNPGGQSATLSPGFFYAAPAAMADFYTVAPCRVLDTRSANGPLGGPALSASGGQRTFTITGRCGVPTTATSVVTNVTISEPTGAGSLSIFPGNAFDFGTSVLNFTAGQVRAGSATLGLATDGTGSIGIRNNSTGSTNVTVDITGYFN